MTVYDNIVMDKPDGNMRKNSATLEHVKPMFHAVRVMPLLFTKM